MSKRIFNNIWMWLLVVSLGAVEARAQSHVYVDVRTNVEEAVLYADEAAVGPAGEGILAVPATARQLRLVASGRAAWSVPPQLQDLEAAPGDTVRLEMNFPYYYRVESVPFGARVYLETAEGWEPVGHTPLVYRAETPIEEMIVVRRPGYAVERITPGTGVWNRYHVDLSPSEERGVGASEVSWQPPRPERRWIDYAAIGVALTAGALAIHYKSMVNRRTGRPGETVDPSLDGEIERYNVYSGVALGVMQAGIGLFAVRLALR